LGGFFTQNIFGGKNFEGHHRGFHIIGVEYFPRGILPIEGFSKNTGCFSPFLAMADCANSAPKMGRGGVKKGFPFFAQFIRW